MDRELMKLAAMDQAIDRATRERTAMVVWVRHVVMDRPEADVWFVRSDAEGRPEGGLYVWRAEPEGLT